ncbi:hypothetical protein [Nonomuraea sp. GTA35]|uniref:hypothetical protein n=1 Tax=Nonomuraea sp. GTA35 TaxID=1676746 RepID=UPI0035C1D3D0
MLPWPSSRAACRSSVKAQVAWKLDPASDEPGYSLQNALLLAAHGPRYYVRRGTFDVSQTVPRERCPHCGTSPASEDDRTTQCPPDCAVFAPRPGSKPPRVIVVELLQAQLLDADEAEGEANQ